MPSGIPSRAGNKGFTILEASLSLVIAVLILSVVYSIHQTIITIHKSTEDREEGPVAVMRLLNEISRDLMCALPLDGADASLTLAPTGTSTNASELTLLFLVPDPLEGRDPEWQSVQRVRYALRETDRHNRELIREITPNPFADEAHTETNILLSSLAAFRVEMLHEGTWSATCQSAKQEDWPKAARILLQREGEQPFQTEVFLPVGCVITSTLSRAIATP